MSPDPERGQRTEGRVQKIRRSEDQKERGWEEIDVISY